MSLPSHQETLIWKKMGFAEKYQLFASTIRQARELKRIGIRLRRPAGSPREIERMPGFGSMQDPDFITLFVAPLAKASMDYIITGSVASSIYGEPRITLDIDLVVLLEKSRIHELPSIWPPAKDLPPSISAFI